MIVNYLYNILDAMVLYVLRWNIPKEKLEAYKEWATLGIDRTLLVSGVIEFRGYRNVNSHMNDIIVTYEFTDLTSWAKWYSHEEIQKIRDELNMLVTDFSADLWEMSPIVPMSIRHGNEYVSRSEYNRVGGDQS